MTGLLKRILERLGSATRLTLRVTLADGSSWQNRPGVPVVHLRYKTTRAQWRTLAFGHIGLLESYFDQSLDVEGDFARAFRIGFESRLAESPKLPVRMRNRWHELTRSNATVAQAKANARFHYGLGTDFYSLWLDHELMMYTCAYWKEGTRTVEEARHPGSAGCDTPRPGVPR